MIKKKSIVWYWHRKHNEWRKGKVIAVNKYIGPSYGNQSPGLWVKERSKKLPYYIPPHQKAYLSSEAKPTIKY